MKKEKSNKIRRNKGEIATKIMAGFLAGLMLLSVCGTGIYYMYTYFVA